MAWRLRLESEAKERRAKGSGPQWPVRPAADPEEPAALHTGNVLRSLWSALTTQKTRVRPETCAVADAVAAVQCWRPGLRLNARGCYCWRHCSKAEEGRKLRVLDRPPICLEALEIRAGHGGSGIFPFPRGGGKMSP